MRPMIWKSRQDGVAFNGAMPGVNRGTVATFAAEYRRGMLAARQVERMAGHLDKVALLLRQDYTKSDR